MCLHKGAARENVQIGELMERAQDEIMKRAEARGVPVTFERP